VSWLDADVQQKLLNELATLSAVITQGLVGPLTVHQDTAPSNAQVFELVGLSLHLSGLD
jgi:hypothetical protein